MDLIQPGPSAKADDIIRSRITTVKEFCQKMGFFPTDAITEVFIQRMCRDELMFRYINTIMSHAKPVDEANMIRKKALYTTLKNGSFSLDTPLKYSVKSIGDLELHETYDKYRHKIFVLEKYKNKPLECDIASLKDIYNINQTEYDTFLNYFLNVNTLNNNLQISCDRIAELNVLFKKVFYCCQVLIGKKPGSAEYQKSIISDWKDHESDIRSYFDYDLKTFVKLSKILIVEKSKVLSKTCLKDLDILFTSLNEFDFSLDHSYDELYRNEQTGNSVSGPEAAEILMEENKKFKAEVETLLEKSKVFRKHTQDRYTEMWKSNIDKSLTAVVELENYFGQFFASFEALSKSVDRLKSKLSLSDNCPNVSEEKRIVDDINKILYKYGISITSPNAITTINLAINRNETFANIISKFKNQPDNNQQLSIAFDISLNLNEYSTSVERMSYLLNLSRDGYNKIDITLRNSSKAIIKGSFHFHEVNGIPMNDIIKRLLNAISSYEILSIMPF